MKAHIETERTRAGLHSLHAGLVQAYSLTMKSAVRAAEESALRNTLFKDRTGTTRGSIHAETSQGFNGPKGFVEARGAAIFLEYGTKPHQIVARRAQFLHFFINGQEFFRRSVQHPGTTARPFMHDARRVGEMAAAYAAQEYVGYAIENAR